MISKLAVVFLPDLCILESGFRDEKEYEIRTGDETGPGRKSITDDGYRFRKEQHMMRKGLSCILLMIFLLVSVSSSFADPSLMLQDSSVRFGPWAESYGRILQERARSIRAYEEYVISVTYSTECRPVGLTDLTGDGIPELIFLELVADHEYGFNLGRLWIYTPDGTGVHCALTLQPEIDDMLYSTVYLGNDRLLTFHFNDTEMDWTMQFRMDQSGHYAAETVLIEQADFSGEGPDYYFLNGTEISASAFRSKKDQIQSAQGTQVGSLMVDDGFCGFAYTLEEAQKELASMESGSVPQPDAGNGGDPMQSQSGGLFPQLSFFQGNFTAGQKFAVYSAPSTRSWRGANGKAAITSGSEIFVAGTDENWILILYELDSGVTRVGYINPEKITGTYTAGGPLSFARTPMTLVMGTEMTDDPVRQRNTIGKLKKGANGTCLAEYQGWIYVEAKVSGKTARGFITPSALGLGETGGSGNGSDGLYGRAI